MLTSSEQARDEEYVRIVIEPLTVCKNYKPKFGHGEGLTLSDSQRADLTFKHNLKQGRHGGCA